MFSDATGLRTMSIAEQKRHQAKVEAAKKWLNSAVGTRIENEADVVIFIATLEAVVKVAGNEVLNHELSKRLIDGSREIKAGDTPLDYYQKRHNQLSAEADRAISGEDSGETERVCSTRMEFCAKIIDFLKGYGAKAASDLKASAGLPGL